MADPREAIAACDIVVSSIPHGSASDGRLDANGVEPGTFVAAVDIGFGWRRDTLSAFDRTVTDNREQSTVGPAERNALIFSGTGIADLAAAIVVCETALAKGIGTRLPR